MINPFDPVSQKRNLIFIVDAEGADGPALQKEKMKKFHGPVVTPPSQYSDFLKVASHPF